MLVESHANQPLSRMVAFGYWISRAESRKFVLPCCTPGITVTQPAQFPGDHGIQYCLFQTWNVEAFPLTTSRSSTTEMVLYKSC